MLKRLYDPEWLPFMAFGLGPAALCLMLYEPRKAAFFAGAAIYLGTLKWLGHAVLGPWHLQRHRYLLFSVEIFGGLAVGCTWFYVRNLVGWIWPASYSLRELAWLAPLVAGMQLIGGFAVWARHRFRTRPVSLLGLLHRAAVYVPFWFMVTVALWEISASLNVQASDAITHAFQARIYVQKGVFFNHINGDRPINYPSAFAAINAATASIAPFSVVQAINLQHVLLTVLALFLISGGIALLTERPLSSLQSWPLAFLSFFPLYGLYPDSFYEALGRQAAPALMAAMCLLPAVSPVADRRSFYRLLAVVAMLTILCATMNPACLPFATVEGIVVLGVCCTRGKREFGLGGFRVAAVLSLFTVLAFAMVLACDGYYRGLLRNLGGPKAVAAPVSSGRAGEEAPGAPASPLTKQKANDAAASNGRSRFSFTAAVEQASTVRPLEVGSPAWQRRTAEGGDAGDWMQQSARAVLPWLAASLGILAWASTRTRRDVSAPAGRSLMRLLLVCALLWLALKYGMTFLAGGIVPATNYASLLKGYIIFLSLRCELLVAFAAVLAAAVAVYLKAEAWVRALPPTAGATGLVVALVAGGPGGAPDDASWIDWLPSTDYRSVQAVELLLLFLVLWCALFVLYQAALGVRGRIMLRNASPVAVGLFLYLLPFAIVLLNPSPGGVVTLRPHPHGDEAITPDDLELVAWVDANIPPESGLIGLTPFPFEGPYGREERYMHPFGAAQALLLYGKEYNICFCQQDPSRGYGYDDYQRHVQHTFDAGWCLANNIRYFYVSYGGIRTSPGLGQAIEEGHLKLLRQGSSCGVYEVVR
jgi:hypothetical protein